MSETVQLMPGMDVFAADGDKVGSINEVRDDYIVVEKGFFFPKDYYIPINSIEGVTDDDKVYLLVSKDDALSQNWDTIPESVETTTPYATQDTLAGTAGYNASREGATGYASPDGASEVIAPDYTAATDTTGTLGTTEDATRVPIYEEEVTPVKRPVSRGTVRIKKELVTEDRTVSVPVTEERVRVTRVDTDEPVSADASGVLEEGEIEVPLQGEEVSLEKTARKTGEVVVEKEAEQHDQQVSSKVRREDVQVDDSTIDDTSLRTRRSA